MKLYLLLLSLLIVGINCQVACPTFGGIEYPDIEGRCNNQAQPQWASTGHTLIRSSLTGPLSYKGGVAEYADGIGAQIKREKSIYTSVRDISNIVHAQPDTVRVCTPSVVADFLVFFGQALNHDQNASPNKKGITEQTGATAPERANILLPPDDQYFNTYVDSIPFTRSDVVIGTGLTTQREQIDELTAYVDLSIIYSARQVAADLLREYTGGRLYLDPNGKTLPILNDICNFQATRLGQDPLVFVPDCRSKLAIATPHPFSKNPDQVLVSGDARVGENFALLSMHTLFAFNHNYWAAQYAAQNPALLDDELYYKARSRNIAEFQNIAYTEYFPTLLGIFKPAPWTGYDPTIDASSNQEFVTAALRHGHSQLSGVILRRYENGSYAGEDSALRDTYFQWERSKLDGGWRTVLQGLRYQKAQPVDLTSVDGVRNFLFGPGDPSLGMDLLALNIERARDHGILPFNKARKAYGLPPINSFIGLTRNRLTAAKLASLYNTVDDCDLWVCGQAEKPIVSGGLLPETFAVIIQNQWQRTRKGDRFYWENQCGKIFTQAECDNIRTINAATVIGRYDTTPTYSPFFVPPTVRDRNCRRAPFLDGVLTRKT